MVLLINVPVFMFLIKMYLTRDYFASLFIRNKNIDVLLTNNLTFASKKAHKSSPKQTLCKHAQTYVARFGHMTDVRSISACNPEVRAQLSRC